MIWRFGRRFRTFSARRVVNDATIITMVLLAAITPISIPRGGVAICRGQGLPVSMRGTIEYSGLAGPCCCVEDAVGSSCRLNGSRQGVKLRKRDVRLER